MPSSNHKSNPLDASATVLPTSQNLLDLLEPFHVGSFKDIQIKLPQILRAHNFAADLAQLLTFRERENWLNRYTAILDSVKYSGHYQSAMLRLDQPAYYNPSTYRLVGFLQSKNKKGQGTKEEKIKCLCEELVSLHYGMGWSRTDIELFLAPFQADIKKHLSKQDPDNSLSDYGVIDCFFIEALPQLKEQGFAKFLTVPELHYEKTLLEYNLSTNCSSQNRTIKI